MLGALCLLLCATTRAAAPQPAFPGAEGFGAYAKGGRGGRVIEVTNLNARGPGSLQAACDAKGPRIVVFRVSGIIDGSVHVKEPFCTIAGQTAPGDGICIRSGELRVHTHDVVIRYLRSRPGGHPLGPNGENRDCFDFSGNAHDVIIDHCSFSWTTDENVTTWGRPRNATIQWCISSEALCDGIHPKGPHSMGMLLGKGDNTVTVHHCLLAHNNGRNPRMSNKPGNPPSIFDIRNNVIYDHGRYGAATAHGDILLNFVGNTFKMGPSSYEPHPRGLYPYGGEKTRIYVDDNNWRDKPKGVDEWRVVDSVLLPDRELYKPELRGLEPIDTPAVTTESAAQAYESVLKYAGCRRPVRDVVDDRIVAEVRAGTGQIIDSPRYVGGYPTYASAAPPPDADHDAMPDAWERRHGFNPKDPADGPRDLDGDGYTNVEEFLNLTDPAKPDTGVPAPPPVVVIQSGNDRMRRDAGRKTGKDLLAKEQTPLATHEAREALLKKVRESGKRVADVLGLRFVKIEPGEFELWEIKIKITKPFEIGIFEVTQTQWQMVMGTRPWLGQPAAQDNPQFPATYISHLDTQEFIARLNASGDRQYGLPTQAEWRLAAHGGTDFLYGFQEDEQRVPEYAWCCYRVYKDKRMAAKHFPTFPQAVGKLKPNPFGVYDMAGNVRELVSDYASYHYYSDRAKYGSERTDPTGPDTGECRTVCGGHFRYVPSQVLRRRPFTGHRPHYRGFGLGFRLRRALP